MALLFFLGIATLVGFMVMLMGVLFMYYLKRDLRWEASGRQVDRWF